MANQVQEKIKVVSPFRCGGKLVKVNKVLTVDKDLPKQDARRMVACKKAVWVTPTKQAEKPESESDE